MSAASADEVTSFARSEQLNQDLLASDFGEVSDVELGTLPIEEEPEPEPEPEPEEEPEEEDGAPSVNMPSMYTGGGDPAKWMAAAGIAESDWGYVDSIVQRESGWNPNAVNASSGASGLVQALPCSKVPGSCFDPVDNLKWADGYAKSRYGSWSAAVEFWEKNHWW